MKLFYCLMILLCPYAGMAQGIKSLDIGDKVPDVALGNIINYTTPSATIADFKGKLLILDFWATWCAACVKNFPHMEALQKKYNDKIQVVGVTQDSEKKAATFLEKYVKNTGKNFSIPTVVNGALLARLFPHTILPHYVWINSEGIVMAITSATPVTGENIEAVLAGKNVKFSMKEDMMNFDYATQLYMNGNGGKGDNILYRSLIAGPIAGVGTIIPAFMKSSKEPVSRMFAINCSILDLYKIAFEEPGDYPAGRIVLQVKNPAALRYVAGEGDLDSWKAAHTFCYELIVPPATVCRIKEEMADDLQRCFGYKAFYENRIMDCLILTADSSLLNSYTKSNEAEDNLGESGSPYKYIYNQPVDALVSYLNSKPGLYIINETGCDANLDIHFPDDISDTSALINALKMQGLHLAMEKRQVKVFVISDN